MLALSLCLKLTWIILLDRLFILSLGFFIFQTRVSFSKTMCNNDSTYGLSLITQQPLHRYIVCEEILRQEYFRLSPHSPKSNFQSMVLFISAIMIEFD